MAMHPKHISRANDIYPAWDADAVNNVGSVLAVGDLVLIDWTLPGDPVSLISPFTAVLISTRMKAIVKTQPGTNGIAVGATGQVRIQGQVYAGLKNGIVATAKDPITADPSGNATDGGLITTNAVAAPGTNSTYIQPTMGAFLETVASSLTAQLVNVIFDGTQINAIFLKD